MKWEYKVLQLNGDMDHTDDLNELGRFGWEVCSSHALAQTYENHRKGGTITDVTVTYVLKRRVEE